MQSYISNKTPICLKHFQTFEEHCVTFNGTVQPKN